MGWRFPLRPMPVVGSTVGAAAGAVVVGSTVAAAAGAVVGSTVEAAVGAVVTAVVGSTVEAAVGAAVVGSIADLRSIVDSARGFDAQCLNLTQWE